MNYVDKHQTTALNLAAEKGLVEIAKKLIKNGANVNFMGKGYSALHMAAQNGFAEVAKLLLDNGAYVNAMDKDKLPYTPLDIAFKYDQAEVTMILSNHGGEMQNDDAYFAAICDNDNSEGEEEQSDEESYEESENEEAIILVNHGGQFVSDHDYLATSSDSDFSEDDQEESEGDSNEYENEE